MSAGWLTWLDQYTAALRDYVARSDEANLERAYELGRQMVGDERAMLDLVDIYHRELSLLVRATPTPDDRDRTTALAQAFLRESLSPFAMAQRGFRDAITRLRDLHQLLEFQHTISGALQVTQVVEGVVAHAPRPLGADACALLLPQPDGSWDPLTTAPGAAQPPPSASSRPAGPERELVMRAVQARDPIVADFVPADGGGDANRRGVGSQLVVALRSGEQVLGVLAFQATATGAFGPPEVALAHLMAEYAAQALGRAGLLEEIQQQNSALEAATRHKSAFLANMSHEFRTPLNAIIGFAELMHDGKVGPVSDLHREFLGDILTSSSHLLQIINDILDLAKVEAGKIEVRPEEVDIPKLVGEVQDVLRTLAAAKLLRIAVEVDPALTTVVADPSRLKQILYNYLSNAIKFTPDHGRVTIRVVPEDADHFRLEVADSGIGIQPQDMERLFGEFQQPDAGAAKKYQGTGLGLALTRRIAEALGGRVGVRSTPGAGSIFFAVLPRVAASARPNGAGLRDHLQGYPGHARRRIQVVEEEVDTP